MGEVASGTAFPWVITVGKRLKEAKRPRKKSRTGPSTQKGGFQGDISKEGDTGKKMVPIKKNGGHLNKGVAD